METLSISLRLKMTYWVNSRLYTLKRIPLIKRILPDSVFRFGGMKNFFTLLGAIREFLSAFVYKYIYVVLLIGLPIMVMGDMNPGDVFTAEGTWNKAIQIFFFLTLVGGIINTDFFDGKVDKYYALEMLKLDPRKYTLVNFGYLLLRFFLGFALVFYVGVRIFNQPLWWVILSPLYVVSSKLCYSWIELLIFNKKDKRDNDEIKEDNAKGYILTFLIGALLASAYVFLGAGVIIPQNILAFMMLGIVLLGLISGVMIVRYGNYRGFCRFKISEYAYLVGLSKNGMNLRAKEVIENTGDITSSKQGFEYLNDLFIKRHRKILWKSTKRITIISLGVIGAVIVFLLLPFTAEEGKTMAAEFIRSRLSTLPLVLYFINRGRDFTQALFMNCDHSLLTYSFYKEPKRILELFRLRLVEISKINIVPAVVIGAGLVIVMLLSGSVENPAYYPLVFFSVLGISIFFSVHYLVMYYLLQPYTIDTEATNPIYTLVMLATYIPCYIAMQSPMPILPFGIGVISFSVIYSVIALVLVYKLAYKTFKIRQ